MKSAAHCFLVITFCAASAASVLLVTTCYAVPSGQAAPQATAGAATRRIGAVKAITGTTITLTPDTGPEVSISVLPVTRILRIAPGEKDPEANATPIQLQDMQVGDRILVSGTASADNQSLIASTIVAMKRSDLEARHRAGPTGLAEAWNRRPRQGCQSQPREP